MGHTSYGHEDLGGGRYYSRRWMLRHSTFFSIFAASWMGRRVTPMDDWETRSINSEEMTLNMTGNEEKIRTVQPHYIARQIVVYPHVKIVNNVSNPVPVPPLSITTLSLDYTYQRKFISKNSNYNTNSSSWNNTNNKTNSSSTNINSDNTLISHHINRGCKILFSGNLWGDMKHPWFPHGMPLPIFHMLTPPTSKVNSIPPIESKIWQLRQGFY